MSGAPPNGEPPFPGLPTVTDGTGAVVWVETHISQAACAYPITPSTNMGVDFARAASDGMANLWGDVLAFVEPESEHSSASAAEGFALAGGRVTNFTSGQGLVLMKEVLYVISGKRLPVVFNIGSRALTSQALNVHAGHDDVMAVTDVGWGMLFARNAQEAADLCLIARRAAESGETPVLNIQDGFLTTHTLQSLRLPEPDLMRQFVGAPGERLRPLFDPQRGIMSGVVQNQDAYMKGKIAQRHFTDQLAPVLTEAMNRFGLLTGRCYSAAAGYRMYDADYALVALGTIAETAEAVADYLREAKGMRVGVVHPTVFRPFPGADLVNLLKGVRALAVIERMDNPLGESNPLTMELKAAFSDALSGAPGFPRVHRIPDILSGSGGLGSREVRPADLIAVVEAMAAGRRSYFSLNIDHPTALPITEHPDLRPEGSFSMRGYSVGGYGSVTTNKVIAQVAADLFGLQVQAYPKYGSEKKGLPTNYYLTLAPQRIRIHAEMDQAEFVPLNNVRGLREGNPCHGLTLGGAVFVQWDRDDPAELWSRFPLDARRAVQQAEGRVFYLDAARIAREEAPSANLEVRMQGIALLGVFLKCTPFREQLKIGEAVLFERMEAALQRTFGKLSPQALAANARCARRGYEEVKEVPRELIAASAGEVGRAFERQLVADVMHRGVVTCGPDDSLADVQRVLAERHISAVVVVNAAGELEGIMSTTDLARASWKAACRAHLPDVLPRHLMTRDVLVTWPQEPLAVAVERMLSKRVHRLVVVESQQQTRRPVGILSMTDLARPQSH